MLSISIIPVQVLLSCTKICSFHNWVELKEGPYHLSLVFILAAVTPPTGIRLSLLFVLAAVTDGQNVTVLVLVTAW